VVSRGAGLPARAHDVRATPNSPAALSASRSRVVPARPSAQLATASTVFAPVNVTTAYCRYARAAITTTVVGGTISATVGLYG